MNSGRSQETPPLQTPGVLYLREQGFQEQKFLVRLQRGVTVFLVRSIAMSLMLEVGQVKDEEEGELGD